MKKIENKDYDKLLKLAKIEKDIYYKYKEMESLNEKDYIYSLIELQEKEEELIEIKKDLLRTHPDLEISDEFKEPPLSFIGRQSQFLYKYLS